jgi:hypothetical protein
MNICLPRSGTSRRYSGVRVGVLDYLVTGRWFRFDRVTITVIAFFHHYRIIPFHHHPRLRWKHKDKVRYHSQSQSPVTYHVYSLFFFNGHQHASPVEVCGKRTKLHPIGSTRILSNYYPHGFSKRVCCCFCCFPLPMRCVAFLPASYASFTIFLSYTSRHMSHVVFILVGFEQIILSAFFYRERGR